MALSDGWHHWLISTNDFIQNLIRMISHINSILLSKRKLLLLSFFFILTSFLLLLSKCINCPYRLCRPTIFSYTGWQFRSEISWCLSMGQEDAMKFFPFVTMMMYLMTKSLYYLIKSEHFTWDANIWTQTSSINAFCCFYEQINKFEFSSSRNSRLCGFAHSIMLNIMFNHVTKLHNSIWCIWCWVDIIFYNFYYFNHDRARVRALCSSVC